MKTSSITRQFIAAAALTTICSFTTSAETVEPIKYGDMEQWVTRNVPESKVIGGKTKSLYEIAPNSTIDGAVAYTNQGGSPWATSNVMAKVVGVVKGSNAVFPDTREGGGRCCKLSTVMEQCKAMGLVNMEVIVPGSIFLGKMLEPVKSTKNPYSKMEMGIPFTKRPLALQFDYKIDMPANATRIYAPGFGSKKELGGHDNSEVYVILQRRWEDKDGNLYAKRVGTGREQYGKSTSGWVNGHRIAVKYGDITSDPEFKSFMDLIPEENSYYARNSKGEMVPVKEVGWDAPDATPTHIMVMASAGSGDAYVGTPGLTLWVDNFSLVY
ncbi:MAG: glycoside hydrolase xylanase [Bacteroidales bacterium]|nr:glycoside hydrolase xylanase [Bacteroidales bacterium]